MNARRMFYMFLCLFAAGALATQAAIVVDPGLPPGTEYRLVFITYGAMAASEADIQIYNNFVAAEANASAELASLSAGWSVIGSAPGVNARDNTGTNPLVETGVPIYNLAGELVAADNADLWDGTLQNAIDVDQYGAVWFGRQVLTGSIWDGTGRTDRQYSGPNSYRVEYGYSDQTGSGWIDANDYQGTLAARQYYAISDRLVAIPEPSTMALISLTGIAFLTLRRFRIQ